MGTTHCISASVQDLTSRFAIIPCLSSMPNTPKVVPFDQRRFRVIAADEKTNRIIFAIGRQRVALDMSTRITELTPDVGDKPAKILPLITPRKRKKQ